MSGGERKAGDRDRSVARKFMQDRPEPFRIEGLSEYQTLTARFDKPLPPRENVQHATLGLVTEAAEVADLVMKSHFRGRELWPYQVAEELGDVLFEIAHIARAFGLNLEQIATDNYRKLTNRHGDQFRESYLTNADKT